MANVSPVIALLWSIPAFAQLAPSDASTATYRIAGIELGMSSGTVAAKLGIPTRKSGLLASAAMATAYWKAQEISILFGKGKVASISSRMKHPLTTLIDIGATMSDAEKAYGEPTDMFGEPIDQKTRATVKTEYFLDCLIQYECDDGRLITKLSLDKDDHEAAKAAKANRRPDYRLKLDGLSWDVIRQDAQGRRGTNVRGMPTEVVANGLVTNERAYVVDITVRVKFISESGRSSTVRSQTLAAVKPGEFRSFRVTSFIPQDSSLGTGGRGPGGAGGRGTLGVGDVTVQLSAPLRKEEVGRGPDRLPSCFLPQHL
jgi:hypothetical protein